MIQQHDTMDASQLRIARGSLPRAPRAPPHRGHCPRALARAQADTHQQTWRAYRFQGMSSEALRRICQAGLVPPLAASLWPRRPRRCQVRAERPYLSSPLWCQRCSRPLQAAHHGASAAARRFGLAPPAATGSAGGRRDPKSYARGTRDLEGGASLRSGFLGPQLCERKQDSARGCSTPRTSPTQDNANATAMAPLPAPAAKQRAPETWCLDDASQLWHTATPTEACPNTTRSCPRGPPLPLAASDWRPLRRRARQGGAGIQRATQGARGTLKGARALGQGSLDRSCASGNKILQAVATHHRMLRERRTG